MSSTLPVVPVVPFLSPSQSFIASTDNEWHCCMSPCTVLCTINVDVAVGPAFSGHPDITQRTLHGEAILSPIHFFFLMSLLWDAGCSRGMPPESSDLGMM